MRCQHRTQKTKDTYWAAHGDKASLQGRNYGAHLAYLAAFVAANPSGYAVGSSLTMADLCIWDIVDLHARIYPEQARVVIASYVFFYSMM